MFLGDASNFDEYEEEPRTKKFRMILLKVLNFNLFFFSVRIATTEKFGKEFEEF